MAYLTDTIKEYLHPELVAEAADMLGEGEAQTRTALHAWCTAIMAGLLDYADHPKAMSRIFRHLGLFPPDIAQQPKALLRRGNLAENDPKEISGRLLGQLFGPKMQPLINNIAGVSGASAPNVSFLLGVAGPVVLSILGQRVQAGQLSVSGLSNLFLADCDRILAALPEEMKPVLALHAVGRQDETLPQASTGFQWALSLFLLISSGVLILLLLRQFAG